MHYVEKSSTQPTETSEAMTSTKETAANAASEHIKPQKLPENIVKASDLKFNAEWEHRVRCTKDIYDSCAAN